MQELFKIAQSSHTGQPFVRARFFCVQFISEIFVFVNPICLQAPFRHSSCNKSSSKKLILKMFKGERLERREYYFNPDACTKIWKIFFNIVF